MNTTPAIEYGGWSGCGMRPDQVAIKLRNAPAWVRERAAGATRAAPATAKPTRQPDRAAVIGWLAGTVCPAVSDPAYSSYDARHLPEQFSDACMAAMRRQTVEQAKPIPITWGHRGPVICTTRNLDALFFVKASLGIYAGLEFQARLDLGNALHRQVLDEAAEGLGVSIGYVNRRQSIVTRDGIGEVRVIHEASLDHVAILPRASKLQPAFPAARCFAAKGRRLAPPVELHERARVHAWQVWKRQCGVTT